MHGPQLCIVDILLVQLDLRSLTQFLFEGQVPPVLADEIWVPMVSYGVRIGAA
jgi:hypothetical protein